MSILEIVKEYWQEGLWALLIGGFIIQITPIKINPYTWLASKIGNALNYDLFKKIDSLESEVHSMSDRLANHIEENKQEAILDIRVRILAFADDVRNGVNHSKERYDQVLNEITRYNNYCVDHPEFPNAAALHAIAYIEEEYDLRLHGTKDFLM